MVVPSDTFVSLVCRRMSFHPNNIRYLQKCLTCRNKLWIGSTWVLSRESIVDLLSICSRLHHASFGQPGFARKSPPMQVVRSICKHQRHVFVSSLALPADGRFAMRNIAYQGCCWSS